MGEPHEDHPHGTPPGRDPDFVPPGHGGNPPGQDKPDDEDEEHPEQLPQPHPEPHETQ